MRSRPGGQKHLARATRMSENDGSTGGWARKLGPVLGVFVLLTAVLTLPLSLEPATRAIERTIDHGRGGALVLGQVTVARTQREAVLGAHGRRTDDRDGQVQVLDGTSDHGELLEVLLAEDRDVRRHLGEQFGDDGGDAAEEVRAEPVLEPGLGGACRFDANGEAFRIHDVGCRRPDEIGAGFGQRRDVRLESSRVTAEVLGRRELGRVDEDGDDDPVGAAARLFDKGKVAAVQRAHGRHQPKSAS